MFGWKLFNGIFRKATPEVIPFRIDAFLYVHDGDKKKLEWAKENDSWVCCAWYAFYLIFYCSGVSPPDINNATHGWTAGAFLYCSGAAGGSQGPVVGTGTNAVAFADYKLQTEIVHGNGAGQLFRNAATIDLATTVGSSRYFNINRTFNNNSGGDITINECGLHCQYYGQQWYHLLARDLVSPGVLVSNTKVASLQYRVTITV